MNVFICINKVTVNSRVAYNQSDIRSWVNCEEKHEFNPQKHRQAVNIKSLILNKHIQICMFLKCISLWRGSGSVFINIQWSVDSEKSIWTISELLFLQISCFNLSHTCHRWSSTHKWNQPAFTYFDIPIKLQDWVHSWSHFEFLLTQLLVHDQKWFSTNHFLLLDKLVSFSQSVCVVCFLQQSQTKPQKHCKQLISDCFTLGALSLSWEQLVTNICRLNNNSGGDRDGGGEWGPDGGSLIRL